MVTGVIKSKVDKIWDDIAAGGITNPLTVIEQLTYLMFIRSLDEKELETEAFENLSGEPSEKIFPPSPAGQSMRWSKFKDRDPREIFDILSQRVFPAIKNLKNGKLPDFNDRGEMILPEDDAPETDRGKLHGRILTPDGLRLVCAGLDNDPEKIGIHMLEMLAKFRNEGIVE